MCEGVRGGERVWRVVEKGCNSENRSHVLVCKKWSVMRARMEGVQKVRM